MSLKPFLSIFLLLLFSVSSSFGQAIAHFEFDDDGTLTQNLVGKDANSINPNARSDGEGVYTQARQNIDLTFDEDILNGNENIYLEFDFRCMEEYAWLISAGDYKSHLDPKEFFGIGHHDILGIRLRYYTTANPDQVISPDPIQVPGQIPVARGERAKISFIYNKDEGIAYLLKNGTEFWRTPEADRTPGAAFHWFTKTGEFTVGWQMDGEGSTTPSLYSFKAYSEPCGDIQPPVAESIDICSPGPAYLEATGGFEGNYRWYETEDAEESIADEYKSSFTTPLLSRTTTYYVANVEGPCESERTAVTVTVLAVPEAPQVQDGESCGPGSVTLTAEGSTEGNYRWYSSKDAEEPIAGVSGSSYTTSTLSSSTTFFVAVVGENSCESERIAVTAHIYPVPDAPQVQDRKHCGPGTVTLTASGGSEGNYRWYETANATQPLSGIYGSSFTTPEIQTTTTYYVSITNEHCESERVAVNAEILEVPDAPTGIDVERCGPGTFTLTVEGSTNGNYRWYTSENPDETIEGAVNSTFTTPELNSSKTYFVSINDGACESARKAIKAIVLPLPDAPQAENQESCGEGVFTFTASGGRKGDYRWYRGETDTNPIAGETSNTFTTGLLSQSKAFYVAVVDEKGCESKRTKVEATVHFMPEAPLDQNLEQCGPGELTINVQLPGNSENPLSFKWYKNQGDSNPEKEENSGTLNIRVTQDTILYVSSSNGLCESNKVPVYIKVNELPFIDAGEDLTILKGESIQLQAQSLNGELFNCTWEANESLDRLDIPNPTAKPHISTSYIVKRVNSITGCVNSDTVTVFVTNKFPMPNAFSPNNDGLNDTWEIPNIENYPDCILKIYNSWGNQIFYSKGYQQAWDGTFNGQEIPSGTYYYSLHLSNEHEGLQGSVFVIK